MIRRNDLENRVTLMLQDVLDRDWPLFLSADCAQFIGRYRRVGHFGPGSGLLHFLEGEVRGAATSFR